MSYFTDLVNQFHQAESYVDRILKGEKPADLPVQAPIKYETVLNLKPQRRLDSLSRRRYSCWPTR
jgi:putative ABC transport system substrate-binding protein